MSPCMRCKGLVIVQHVSFTRFDELKYFPKYMFRCLNCGDYFDALVLLNRRIFEELLDEKHGSENQTKTRRSESRVIVRVYREKIKRKTRTRHGDLSRYR